jgi:Ni,Fe-hydrogenase maturation factor
MAPQARTRRIVAAHGARRRPAHDAGAGARRFGHAPQAWWLTIPAVKLDFSETLTPEAQRGFAEAVEKIQELCRSADESSLR